MHSTRVFPVLVLLVALLPVSLPGWAGPESWRAEWPQTDFGKHSVAFDEIVSGGPAKDGIPAIDDPRFVEAAEIDELSGREPVIRLAIGEDVRAYPLSVLMWHEIVNDVVGGVPVAVTYCPLCNSSVVFDRRVAGRRSTSAPPASCGTRTW